MSKTVFVRPASRDGAGSEETTLVIPQPDRNMDPLPKDGAEVIWNDYWIRRKKVGDIVVGQKPVPISPSAPKPLAQKKGA